MYGVTTGQGYTWFDGSTTTDVNCAKRCVGQAGCKAGLYSNVYPKGCQMYNFVDGNKPPHYDYMSGYNMVYPWTTPLPTNKSGLPTSRDNLLGTWIDTSNKTINITIDNTNNTSVRAVNTSDNTVMVLSVDVANKAIYWVGNGVLANMPDLNTIMFSNGVKWIRM